MAWQGMFMKAAPAVATGVVGVAAYEALRTAVTKAPLRKATVSVTAWGLRAVREAERKAEASAEQARLTVADVMSEARERAAEDVPPPTMAREGHNHDR
ncbi:DUF1490 family protein [Mycobacterium spongiae]|uniref:DUF1490 family protein n=1 Tax=Mycobacterium spongiae TaxID=886343 RepID=A0A975K1D6_9MYCO|nr:DUF1490 family protein [Mycobacterium spongiae]QUR69586.1 DUF1490 family protein [Mycobacterium spongiae]